MTENNAKPTRVESSKKLVPTNSATSLVTRIVSLPLLAWRKQHIMDRVSARDAITEGLGMEPDGHILTPDDLTAWGTDFPSNEYGGLFFLMDPGGLLCPSFMGEKPPAGMHGDHPEDKDSGAAFMTNTTGIPRPDRLDDVHALMRGGVDK